MCRAHTQGISKFCTAIHADERSLPVRTIPISNYLLLYFYIIKSGNKFQIALTHTHTNGRAVPNNNNKINAITISKRQYEFIFIYFSILLLLLLKRDYKQQEIESVRRREYGATQQCLPFEIRNPYSEYE